jgi:hypothetical protein
MSGDDWYVFYISGVRVREGGFARGRCDVEEVTKYLRAGENVFAAQLRSPVEPAGLLLEAMFCYRGGPCKTAVVTDRTWRFSANEEKGWNEPGFDDSAWSNCIELSRPPSGAWGPIPWVDPRLSLRVVAVEPLVARARQELHLKARLMLQGETGDTLPLNLRLERHGWVYFTTDLIAQPVKSQRKTAEYETILRARLPEFLPGGTYGVRIEEPGAKSEQGDFTLSVVGRHKRKHVASAQVKALRPGLPMLLVNGQPLYPYVYTPYSLLATGRLQPEAARLTKGQFRIYSFGTNVGWVAEGKHDFGHMDECALTILARDPKGYLLPRVDISAPPWWCAAHEGELTRYADGTGWVSDVWGGTRHQSFASELWQRGAEDGLRRLVAHVLASPYCSRVIGYQIGNGIYGEWHYWSPEHMPDTSEPMQKAFDRFLLQKYGQAMECKVPGQEERLESQGMFLDPVKQRRLIDYYQCYHDVSSKALSRFCRAVKEASGGRSLAGAFYAYIPDLWWGSEGFHLSVDRVLNNPDVDFVASPHSYSGRFPGQDAGFRAYIGTIRAHGKLFFDEADDRTYLAHAREPFRFTPTPWGSVQLLRREFVNALAHNVGLWYFSLEQQFFDSDLFASEFRRMRRTADAAVRFLQPRRPDIALIADPQALIYVAHFKTGKDPLTFHMFNEQLREAAKIGASYDLYLLSDLCAGLVPEHRLYLFLNTFRMTPNERAAVRKQCFRPGKVVMFLGPAGYSDGASISWENTAALTGFDVVPLPGPVQLTTEIETDGPSW